MGESRKDWIAARKIGARLGWFGAAPESSAELLSLARPREFDTIVATQLPEESAALLLGQLAAGGRLLIAVPFGEPYPSQLIAELRVSSAPHTMDLEAGELRMAVEKREPDDAAWELLASPAQLLALTERGASEREARRRAELDTLRAAYQRLAERSMARAVEEAGPSIAAALRIRVLDDRVADLADRLKTAADSTDARIGRALRLAITSPREAARLPVRLLRARAAAARTIAPPLPPPSPVDRDLVSLLRRSPDRLALIVDGRTHEQAAGLERELAGAGWGLVLALGKDSREMRAAQKIVRIEIDQLVDLFPLLERADTPQRIAIFRTPHPIAPRWINRLNAWGWTTIYDCIDDWPERLRLGRPHRYRRSLERFLIHNADLLAATPLEVERLIGLTLRGPRIIEDLGPAHRAEALADAALSLRTKELAAKTLHARDPT